MRKGNQKNTNDESPVAKKLLKKNGKTFHNAAALDITYQTIHYIMKKTTNY